MPTVAAARGHEASRLGEHGDQRSLAQEGRLAAHVGAGDQPQPVVRTEPEIVGDEALAAAGQRLFDDRMPARLDLKAGLVRDVRHAPAALDGTMGVGGRNVDPRDRFGGRDDARCGRNRELGQLLHMRGLGRKRVGARLDDSARFLVKLGRVEAHDACQRLTVREAAVGRHQSCRACRAATST